MTRSKIRHNAVTSPKVGPDALTGGDIRESTLARVPDARHADNATSANSANSANTAGNANTLRGRTPGDFVSTGEYKEVIASMEAGDERVLLRNGPISVYARCATAAGNDELRMFARTGVNGAIMLTSWGDRLDGTDATDFLNTTTPETDREWDHSADEDSPSDASTPTGVTKIVDHYDDNHLIAPTGEAISWESEAELIAFNYLGARCLVAGNVHLYKLR